MNNLRDLWQPGARFLARGQVVTIVPGATIQSLPPHHIPTIRVRRETSVPLRTGDWNVPIAELTLLDETASPAQESDGGAGAR